MRSVVEHQVLLQADQLLHGQRTNTSHFGHGGSHDVDVVRHEPSCFARPLEVILVLRECREGHLSSARRNALDPRTRGCFRPQQQTSKVAGMGAPVTPAYPGDR